MLKSEYLKNGSEPFKFSVWLAEVIAGEQPLHFQHSNGQWSHLSNCLETYQWPAARNTGPQMIEQGWDFPPGSEFTLKAGATLEANNTVLERLGSGLRRALTSGQKTAPWVAAILVWGGVYHQRSGSNQKWLHENLENLNETLSATKSAFLAGSDLIDQPNLRFNSGLTKVYSLIIDDFVIYDSRVAAALAWLVQKRFGNSIPSDLRFPCMPAASAKLCRNPLPGKAGFPSLGARPKLHAQWNVRANWIISEAFKLASAKKKSLSFSGMREVEAALFTMGYDLRMALPADKQPVSRGHDPENAG